MTVEQHVLQEIEVKKHDLITLSLVGVLLTFAMAGCPSTNATSTGVSVIPGATTTGSVSTTSGGTSSSSGSSGSSGTTFNGCLTPTDEATAVQRILELVNLERTSRGLDALTINATLTREAGDYACELIEYDYFAHENPVTGSTLVTRTADAGYRYSLVGENLAAGQRTADEAMDGWMNSEGHRANILKPEYEEIGIAVREGGDYGIYWVQEFGKPL